MKRLLFAVLLGMLLVPSVSFARDWGHRPHHRHFQHRHHHYWHHHYDRHYGYRR